MKTPIIKIDPQHIEREKVKRVAEVLRNSGLVIVPTETVYGIVANSCDRRAVEKLYQIKQRPLDKPFTIIVDKKERIEEFGRDIPHIAYKLIDRFWPGPLTIIIAQDERRTVGLRMPAHDFVLSLISEVDFPLFCPSANLSGRKPPTTLEEALIDLDGKIDLAVEGGSASIGKESSVVDLTKESISVLRESAISEKQIQEVVNKKIVLFVCTGNSCRSIMAEALLRKKLKEKNRTDIEVLSAGVAMIEGLKPTAIAVDLLKEEGIELDESYVSKSITPLMIKKADLIFVMEALHEKRIREIVPDVKNVFLLKEFAKINLNQGLDIPDPIGKTEDFYREIFYLIKEAIERIIEII